jgi:hypothetical protein
MVGQPDAATRLRSALLRTARQKKSKEGFFQNARRFITTGSVPRRPDEPGPSVMTIRWFGRRLWCSA